MPSSALFCWFLLLFLPRSAVFSGCLRAGVPFGLGLFHCGGIGLLSFGCQLCLGDSCLLPVSVFRLAGRGSSCGCPILGCWAVRESALLGFRVYAGFVSASALSLWRICRWAGGHPLDGPVLVGWAGFLQLGLWFQGSFMSCRMDSAGFLPLSTFCSLYWHSGLGQPC